MRLAHSRTRSYSKQCVLSFSFLFSVFRFSIFQFLLLRPAARLAGLRNLNLGLRARENGAMPLPPRDCKAVPRTFRFGSAHAEVFRVH
jgi:hypothetical protein